MNILFVRNNLSYPALFAGTENVLHGLCLKLILGGHQVAFCSVSADKPEYNTDKYGYRTYRAEQVGTSVSKALQEFKPDICVVMEVGSWVSSLPDRVLSLPMVCYQHNIHADLKTLSPELREKLWFVANSRFTKYVLSLLNIRSTVVPPIFAIEDYSGVEPEMRDCAVLVSLQKRKGFHIAQRIAKERPNRKFIFINSWGTTQEALDSLSGLQNVVILRNQPDLKTVFLRTRFVMMPSLWTETWGLTASEAQVSKIPVLASNGGNLVDTVGSGGLVVPLSLDIDFWFYAFDRFYDETYYSQLTQKAAERGQQLLGEVQGAYDEFCGVLNRAVGETTK